MQKGSALIITLVVIGLLAVGGAVAYVATDGFGTQNNSQETASDDASIETKTEATEPEGAAELIESALAGGDAVACDFVQNGYPGTTYIASGRNFRVDTQSEEGKAHMVKQDDAAYIWVDGQGDGLEFSGEAYDEDFDERFDSFNPEEFEESADEGNVEEINCERVAIDDSKLELPSDVNFQSWTDMMNSIPSQ